VRDANKNLIFMLFPFGWFLMFSDADDTYLLCREARGRQRLWIIEISRCLIQRVAGRAGIRGGPARIYRRRDSYSALSERLF